MLSLFAAVVVGVQGPMTPEAARSYLEMSAVVLPNRATAMRVLTAKDLRPWLASSNDDASRLAMREVLRRKDGSLIPDIGKRLKTGPLSVQEAAAKTLGYLGGTEAKRLLRVAQQSPDARRRYAAAVGLVLAGEYKVAVPGLIDGAQLGNFPAIRRLRMLRDPRAASPLYMVARKGNPDWADEAMLTAAVSGSAPAHQTLRRWAKDRSSWRRRLAAARGLWTLRRADDKELLRALRKDESPYVARAAAGQERDWLAYSMKRSG